MRTIASQRIVKLSGVSAAVLVALAFTSVNAESARGESFAQRQCEEWTPGASADTAYGDQQRLSTLEECLAPAAGEATDADGDTHSNGGDNPRPRGGDDCAAPAAGGGAGDGGAAAGGGDGNGGGGNGGGDGNGGG